VLHHAYAYLVPPLIADHIGPSSRRCGRAPS